MMSYHNMELPNPNENEKKNLLKFELEFYRLLFMISKHTKIYLNIPETIINGFGFSNPTLICTDYKTGELYIKEGLSKQAVSEIFLFFSRNITRPNKKPIAVIKTNYDSYYKDSNDLIFTVDECESIWDNNTFQGKSQIMQKYIATTKVCVYRSEYLFSSRTKTYLISKKKDKSTSTSVMDRKEIEKLKYLILNNDNYRTCPVTVSVIDSKMAYLVYLIEKYIIRDYNTKIISLKCDWIIDKVGKFYLLNVKEYKIVKAYSRQLRPLLSTSGSLLSLPDVQKTKNLSKAHAVSIKNILIPK